MPHTFSNHRNWKLAPAIGSDLALGEEFALMPSFSGLRSAGALRRPGLANAAHHAAGGCPRFLPGFGGGDQRRKGVDDVLYPGEAVQVDPKVKTILRLQ
jgi:hypothetical protein